jgi:hypothetical protein
VPMKLDALCVELRFLQVREVFALPTMSTCDGRVVREAGLVALSYPASFSSSSDVSTFSIRDASPGVEEEDDDREPFRPAPRLPHRPAPLETSSPGRCDVHAITSVSAAVYASAAGVRDGAKGGTRRPARDAPEVPEPGEHAVRRRIERDRSAGLREEGEAARGASVVLDGHRRSG